MKNPAFILTNTLVESLRLPCLLLLLAGRYVRLPFHGTEGHKTLSNWYTTLLNAYGNPIEHYGDLDLTMQRNRLKQTGAIDRFLI